MPLSEHEQRQLEQIEQSLYADYPKLAQAVRAQDPRVHYKRRVVQAAILFLIGVGLLLAGVISKIIPVGVGGFVVMLGSAMWALTSWRHMGGIVSGRASTQGRGAAAGRTTVTGPGRRGGGRRRYQGKSRRAGRTGRTGRTGKDRSGMSFMERLEERWRRRQEGGR